MITKKNAKELNKKPIEAQKGDKDKEKDNTDITLNDFLSYLKQQFAKAENIKKTWQAPYQEKMSLFLENPFPCYMQGNKELYGNYQANMGTGRGSATAEYYTSRHYALIENFISIATSNITPIGSAWIKVRKNDFGSIYDDGSSEAITNIIRNEIANSNFDETMREFYRDAIVGTSCIMINPNKKDGIICRCVPFYEYNFLEDTYKTIDFVFRATTLKGKEIKKIYSNIYLKDIQLESIDNEKEYDVRDVYAYNNDTDRWDSMIILDQERLIYKNDNPSLACPFHFGRWKVEKNFLYGKGIAFQASSLFNSLQECLKSEAKTIDALRPRFLVKDTALLEKNKITSLDNLFILHVENNNTSDPAILPLQIDPSILQTLPTKKQELIIELKKLFYDTQAGDLGSDKTATEINQIIGEINANLVNDFALYQKQFLKGIAERVIEILFLQGKFKGVDKGLTFKEFFKKERFVIEINNPITRMVKKNISEMRQRILFASEVDPNLTALNRLEFSRYLLDDVLPNESVYTVEEAQQIQQAQQQQAMAMQQQGG